MEGPDSDSLPRPRDPRGGGASARASAVAPQTISPHGLLIDVPLMLVATATLLSIMQTGGAISRREGGILLGGYGLYLGALMLRGS